MILCTYLRWYRWFEVDNNEYISRLRTYRCEWFLYDGLRYMMSQCIFQLFKFDSRVSESENYEQSAINGSRMDANVEGSRFLQHLAGVLLTFFWGNIVCRGIVCFFYCSNQSFSCRNWQFVTESFTNFWIYKVHYFRWWMQSLQGVISIYAYVKYM